MGLLNKVTGNLKQIRNDDIIKKYGKYVTTNEKIVFSFQLIRDILIFTDKRIIEIDLQGITGKRKVLNTILYKNLINVIMESANIGFDDSEIIIKYKEHRMSKEVLEKKLEFPKNFKVETLYKHLIQSIV